MLKDLRYAVRKLLHAKGWTAVVVASLALGIGANAALFSAVNGLLIQKVPLRDPDALVRLRSIGRNDMRTSSSDYGAVEPVNGQPVRATFSYPMFQELRAANEIGLRMALGAGHAAVLRLVLRNGLSLAAVGLALGLAGAFATTRLLSTILFNVTPLDPFVFTAVAVVLASVTMVATIVPAMRAVRIDPLTALRYE